jgi:hypothetical protein
VAICAKQTALLRFGNDQFPLQICQRPHIELEQLFRGLEVVKLESSVVPGVPTVAAFSAHRRDEPEFPLATALLLTLVALMMVVGVSILAASPTELSLSTSERGTADNAGSGSRTFVYA